MPSLALSCQTPSIAQDFPKFYWRLYNTQTRQGASQAVLISAFLTSSGMPSLPPRVTDGMQAPITMKLVTVIESSKPGKAPGPNGLNLIHYKTFQDILSLSLLPYSSFSTSSSSSSFLKRPSTRWTGIYYDLPSDISVWGHKCRPVFRYCTPVLQLLCWLIGPDQTTSLSFSINVCVNFRTLSL